MSQRAQTLGGHGSAKTQLARATKLEVGREYFVAKYWTGNFKGRCLWVSEDDNGKRPVQNPIARFVVTDAMRTRAALHCDYPECVDEMGHDGDHSFAEFRAGIEIEIPIGVAQFLPAVFEQFQKREESYQQGKHL